MPETAGPPEREIGGALMEISNISLRFGGVTALSDVSFDIREGEVRAIIGPNGAGKSSMLNVISGFYHPQAGEIRFRGELRPPMPSHRIARQGIARTFQNIALFSGMTTLDNIMTGRITLMKPRLLTQALWWGWAEREESEHREKVERIIDFLEIQAIRKTPVGRLPYGLQKRVELGRALAAEPALLLLDEPMAGMNVEEKEDMCRFVLDLNDEFGTTIALIEHDMGVVMDISDRVVVMEYGRKIADGTIFSHVFNFPANYWDGASIAVNHIMDLYGGDIFGMKIGLVYHNSAYGKEPIRTLQELSKKHGYEVMLVPVDHPGQEQKSQWLQIRREKPDYLLLWGWGVMNAVAITEAANIRYPMENFIGIWWSGSENDVLPVGERAHGYKALALHRTGADFPLMDEMKERVYDAGLAAGAGDQIGSVLYMRGVYGAVLISEAIRVAQEMHGVSDITPEMMRDGLENLALDEARMTEIGLPNFGPSFAVSCENHGGPGIGWVSQWDANAKQWNIVTDAIQSDKSVIDPLIKEDAAAYAAENNIEPRCN